MLLLASIVPLFLAASGYEAPEGFTSFMQNIFYGLGILGAVAVIYRQFRPSAVPQVPQPVITKRAEELVLAKDHKELAEKVQKLDQRMDDLASEHQQQFQALLEAGETRENRLREGFRIELDHLRSELTRSTGNLHKRVDDILRIASRLEGLLEKRS
jgi:hypothetical protein